jgi:AraC-like DNA-binding protein
LLIKQLAEEMGFSDPYHFSRAFKRVHGIAPQRLIAFTRRREDKTSSDLAHLGSIRPPQCERLNSREFRSFSSDQAHRWQLFGVTTQ